MTKETGGNGCQQCKKAPAPAPPALPEPLAALREAVLDGRLADVMSILNRFATQPWALRRLFEMGLR